MLYGSVRAFSGLRDYFSFTDSLYFGALISATDPGSFLIVSEVMGADRTVLLVFSDGSDDFQ